MNRALIVARMRAGAEADVRRIFAESDTTSLPYDLGVTHRSLYSFGDVYIHLLEMANQPGSSLSSARDLPAFRQIGEDLKPFISPYYPATWRTPLDAVATEFYHWSAAGTGAHRAAD
jgi:hypothetical protein